MSGPIRHIVMWRLRGETPAERSAARSKVKTLFEGLRGRIEGLTHIEVGVDVSDVDYACDVVLFSEFADQAALAAYATHTPNICASARRWATCGSGASRSIIPSKRPAHDRFVHL
ncbi:hypothetical protein AB7M66_010142 [Bradyrhizobium japonicum]